MSEATRTPEATSGRQPTPDSLEAAAASFQGLIFPPSGEKKKPGEPTKAEGQPEPEETDTVPEDEVPETDEVPEEPDAEETDETEPDAEETDETDESEPEVEETDEEPDDVTTTPRSRKIKLPDGTEEEVTEDEAYAGFLRTKDYTRKTQAAAEARKRAEAEEAAASEARSQHLAQLEKVKVAMDRLVPKEPNWAELRGKVSPEELANMMSDWQAFKKQRDEVEATQARVAKEEADAFGKKFEAWRKSEVEALLASVPEWVDQDLGKREAGEMAKYAVSIGYSQEEVDHAVDHRMLLMLRKAMLWDRAQTVGAGKVKPKVKPQGSTKTAAPGGRRTPPKPKSEEATARENLRKDGSLGAAADVFSHMLQRGPKAPRR